MKKFSKVSNVSVNEEPKKLEKKYTEEDVFKVKVLKLMEDILSIRTYGPVDKYQRAGLIKIAGKETFLEALMSLMNDKSLKDQAKLLESLKGKISDWEAIDEGIDTIVSKIDESNRKGKLQSQKEKIVSLYKIYKDDEELLMNQVEDAANKIRDGRKAFYRGLAAEDMSTEGKFPKKIMSKIADKFFFRAKQLGYHK